LSNKKVWFVTGASRGMGVEFVKAALAAGHAVVASGRDTDCLQPSRFTSSSSRTGIDDVTGIKIDVGAAGRRVPDTHYLFEKWLR
jgi:NAD(P)-dependent dehydrogenase (short-subunit alcohol dehydrogenase family)